MDMMSADDAKKAGSRRSEGIAEDTEAELFQGTRQSHVYSATRDSIFQKEITQIGNLALSLEWVFGRNPALPVLCLQDHDELVVLYAGAHVGVIYSHTSNSQHILQGHCHPISCLCVSEDRRWVATADIGLKNSVMIWDSYSGIPVKTMFDCHPRTGVVAMAFSSDTKFLVTLGAEEIQCVCIWDWTNERDELLWFTELNPVHGFQDYIIFNPNNSCQLVSSSVSQVLFYSTAQGRLHYYALRPKKFRYDASSASDAPELAQPSPAPLQTDNMGGPSVFYWKEPKVVTALAGGSIAVWTVVEEFTEDEGLSRDKYRIIQLQNHQITTLVVTDSCFVTGDTKGLIHFYDDKFRLLTQYTGLNLGGIASISFSKECTEGYLNDCTLKPEPFIFRNFVVSSFSSRVTHIDAQNGSPRLLLQNDCEPVHAVACHPQKPTMVMGNHQGVLTVWDYNSKLITCNRIFETEKQIQCVTFDPQGLYLAVGFGSGAVHILNPSTLQSDTEERFHYSKASIHHITFSTDSKYLATADDGKAVTVFRLQSNRGSLSRWSYLGRYQSHYKPIKELLFGVHLDSTQPRLLSLGMDRRLVEYDLENSDLNKLLILSSERVEQSAVPMCMTWYPPLSTEQFLLVASDNFKIKLFNSTTKMCRKTLLGPTYDSPIKKVVILPTPIEPESKSYHLAFITEDKLGLQILPLDGNPYKSNALICHPMGVSTFACSYDSRFVFTAGGSDRTVLTWKINLNALEAAAALGGKDMEPFYNLLEGGRDGQFYKEMEDFFYFCQIRHQGVDTMKKHQVSTTIPLTEVPSLMRALAYYPTEQEIEDMHYEVKFSKYAETGKYVTDIDLDEFIKLYVNHRPASGNPGNELAEAFHVLVDSGIKGQITLQRNELLEAVQAQGEHMTEEEVADCLTALLGLNGREEEEEDGEGKPEYSLLCAIPEEISLEMFEGHILGFPAASVRSGRSSPPK